MIRSVSRVLAGTVLAAAFSQAASASENFEDMAYVRQAVQEVLEKFKTGEPYRWSNPDTGNSGVIIAERTFYLDARTPCRDYRRTTEGWGGSKSEVRGTGCRTLQGWWKLNETTSVAPASEAPYKAERSGEAEAWAEASRVEEARRPAEARDEAPDEAPEETARAEPAKPRAAGKDSKYGRSGPPARGLPDRIPEGSKSAGDETASAEAGDGSEKMDPGAAAAESDSDGAGDAEAAKAEAAKADVAESIAEEIAEIAAAAGQTPPVPRPRPVTPTLASSLPTRSEE